jgi:hypothetical protein
MTRVHPELLDPEDPCEGGQQRHMIPRSATISRGAGSIVLLTLWTLIQSVF